MLHPSVPPRLRRPDGHAAVLLQGDIHPLFPQIDPAAPPPGFHPGPTAPPTPAQVRSPRSRSSLPAPADGHPPRETDWLSSSPDTEMLPRMAVLSLYTTRSGSSVPKTPAEQPEQTAPVSRRTAAIPPTRPHCTCSFLTGFHTVHVQIRFKTGHLISSPPSAESRR